MLRRRQTIGTGLFVAPLLFLSTGCYSPLQITWDDRQLVLSPQESQRLLQPQGLLIVYSEHYDKPEEDSPLSAARRPIRLYDDKGQFLGEYNHTPVNDDPVSITLSPGRYIVVSEASWRLRQVQVEVQNGQTTVVPESLLEQASPASSSARKKVSA
jgi:hypothetical protein